VSRAWSGHTVSDLTRHFHRTFRADARPLTAANRSGMTGNPSRFRSKQTSILPNLFTLDYQSDNIGT
jgi:hypothetical protein